MDEDTAVPALAVPGFFADDGGVVSPGGRHPLVARYVPYTNETFTRALREGVTASGWPLDVLMPRYALDDASIVALRAYLSSLATQVVAGVDRKSIHLATVLTPDADPGARATTLRVLRVYVASRNAGSRGLDVRRRAALNPRYAARRRWRLHVWQLSGEPATWAAQLAERFRKQPVLALVSGAGRDWRPVHGFCEAERVPCLFPNVDVPGDPEPGRYALYLSGGMLTEAAVMARHLDSLGADRAIVQVRRDDPRAVAAANALDAARRSAGRLPARTIVLASGQSPREPLAELFRRPDTAVVLWLDANDLQAVATPEQAEAPPILVSGTMLGPAFRGWPALGAADTVLVAWPFELPGVSGRTTEHTRRWLAARGIDDPDDPIARNTYFAVTLANQGIVDLAGSFSTDYLIERIEHAAARAATTGAYPRMSLGPGQRIASKGAYLVRHEAGALVKASDWTVP